MNDRVLPLALLLVMLSPMGVACPGSLKDAERFRPDAVANADPDANAGADSDAGLDADAGADSDAGLDADAGADSDAGAPSGCIAVAEVPERILGPRCATVGCHAAPAPAAGLDLASPIIAARLVGISGQTCTRMLLIDASQPERSLLYDRLRSTTSCGRRMPLGAAPLSADEEACVLEWVRMVATTSSPGDGR